MRKEKYSHFLTKEYMMGPDSICLLDELLECCPEGIKGGRILDLGCGMAVTSLFLARETSADIVYAADLWISATDNFGRICRWGEDQRIIPVHSDAANLPFANGFFSAVVSVDAYHYFGCEEGFFAEKILPLLAENGCALIAIPGIRDEYEGNLPELMTEWAGDDVRSFHGCKWWREHISRGAENLDVEVRSSSRFDEIWEGWFRSGHEYAAVDKSFLDRGLKEVLDFVIIIVRAKQ